MSHPYDKIASRDAQSFPYDDFFKYPRRLLVDWKEEEPRILDDFLAATGLPADGTRLVMNDKTQFYQLARGNAWADVPWSKTSSAQHSMVAALQKVFGATHSIRYLNNADVSDTGFFAVETHETWRQLEKRYPHVKWFFTPIELLPDTFNTDAKTLNEIGQRYAGV
ncbi:MAG TPA: hypothetical protein VMF52_20525 [Steroidobacteraceae bacterium]|nr:hypothetical protein [Steroidobacteraceae bacterium]